jgi:hypothetical protein
MNFASSLLQRGKDLPTHASHDELGSRAMSVLVLASAHA